MSEIPLSTIRHTAHFSGRVQGVGFRYTTEQVAARYAVTGFVRNLADGRVELVAEGSAEELDRFEADLRKTMRDFIGAVELKYSPATGEFGRFSIAF